MVKRINADRRSSPLRINSTLFVCYCYLCLFLTNALSADDLLTETQLRTAKEVARILELGHYSRRKLDNESSRRAFDGLIKQLDKRHIIFMQEDIARLRRYRNGLDETLRDADVSFFETLIALLHDRLEQRKALANQLLEQDFDFTIDEVWDANRDEKDYARTEEQIRDRWRRHLKREVLEVSGDGSNIEKAVDHVRRHYDSKYFHRAAVTADELLDICLKQITLSFDPQTYYFSPQDLSEFKLRYELKLEGIGAQIAPREDGAMAIKMIVDGGPASLDGRLKIGDVIAGVGEGDDTDIVSVAGMTLRDVVSLIRGKRGTFVRLEVQPLGQNQSKIYRLTREKIDLSSRRARASISTAGDQGDGKPYRFGVIVVNEFYRESEKSGVTKDVRAIIEDGWKDASGVSHDSMNSQDLHALILDLRRNSGGFLEEAIELAGLFIDRGPIVQIRERSGQIEVKPDPDPGMLWKRPLVILTAKSSASASEVLSGAIQDYRRGLIVGDEHTWGKGSVQIVFNLFNDSEKYGAIKLTRRMYYRPNGDGTQGRGVVPDVILPSGRSRLKIGERYLKFSAEWDQIEAAKGVLPAEFIPDSIVSDLQGRSNERVLRSEAFQWLRRSLDRELERSQNIKVTPLNLKAFQAKRIKFSNQNDPTPVTADFYFDEVLAIAADYVGQLKKIGR